ncbi:hypothetical protein MBLNU13_g10015t1 [Cladosporium sp. NU13]
MLSIDTGPITTGHQSTDDKFTSTSPAFREELGRVAPRLLEKFDIISRSRSEDLERYGQLYLKTKSELIKLQEATTLSDDNDGRDDYAIYSPFDENANISPVTNTDSTNSSAVFGQTAEVVRTCRNLLDSAPSSVARSGASNASVGFVRPQAKAATKRIVLSDSTRSQITTSGPSISSAASERPKVEKSKRRIALTDSTKSNGEHDNAQSSRARHAVTTSDALLAIRVNIKLLPAVQLLMASDLTPSGRIRAREHAQAALQYANECDASVALAARCCFYIAHSYYDRDDKTTLPDAVAWFERATEASGGDQPEGQWAQEWLNHYASIKIDADSRPSTAGSWFSSGNKVLSGVWNMITRSNSNETSSAPVSPSAPKPRPNPPWRLYSNGSNSAADQKQGSEERQPSSSSTNNAPISPISITSSTTQDFHGLKWTGNAPYGKGEVINGQQFELVQSPEPINSIVEEEDEEEEKQIPANVLGGLVDAAALKPAYPLSRYRPRRPWPDSEFEVPDYMLEMKYHVVNASSPSESPGASISLSDVKKQQSPTRSSYFASASNTHSRTQSLAVGSPTSPLATVHNAYAQSEPDNVSPRNKKRNSLSLFIRATGLDVNRKRDEAAQMEEGESPAFAPRQEEEGLYRRRSYDLNEHEEV